jgi:hypothetical protein
VGIEKRLRLRLCHAKAAQADVVAATLYEDRPELIRHDGLQEGNVLANQLFLKADRVRRDDDLQVLLFADRLNRGHEIGERLADAGAGLDQKLAAAGNCIGDGLGHLQLLRPGFVAG